MAAVAVQRQSRSSNVWVSWACHCQSSEKCTQLKGRPSLAWKAIQRGEISDMWTLMASADVSWLAIYGVLNKF